MPFKLTGYCRLRSKDGKFKPRRRRMQNVWLYSAKWSPLNKDKRDCRTFQLIKQFVYSWRHLKEGYNLSFYSLTLTLVIAFHHIVDACVEFCFLKKEFLNLTIKYAAITLHYYCDQPSSFSQAPSVCGVQCSTERLVRR